jgi:predicted TPR repeat methyltransferase
LGRVLAAAGQAEAAVVELRESVRLDPSYATGWCNLGLALEDWGRRDEAIDALRRARELARADGVAFIDYHLAAMGAGPPPAVCPPAYLVQLFDHYAPRFEEHLVNNLGYRGPWLLRDALAPLLPAGRALDVIDLGCGTGLCGALFRPLARGMVGVDLSPQMIERSRQRNVYTELVQAHLTPALSARRGAADLILAADVFIYVGDLSPVFRAAAKALRPGGLFAFTLEVTERADFTVEPSRRYAHSLAYVRRVAAGVGLVERHASSAVLRAGETAPVTGAVVVLGRGDV